MSEYGRYYSGFDDRVHSGKSYTDFSLWDTFRALHPLLTLIQPERVNDMVTAMLQMYSEGGRLPMWPNPAETNIMIGTHADPVIADAYVKGFRGFDTALAYKAMLHDVLDPPVADTSRHYGDRDRWTGFEAQAGLTYYKKIGYVPSDRTAESVSRTIEYGIDDYAVAQVARLMGRNADYDQLMQMSRNFKNLYDTSSGFMLPRRLNGTPGGKNSTGKWVGFTEGDQWTYAFGALQDIEGMMYMMNGTSPFLNKLDENFSAGHYRHDNEPGHHYIFLYDYGGQPWKTQALVRENIDRNYRNAPVGINGNEDCGQMAAWYLFGVMGFYPVVPASGYYAIGAPQFPELTLIFSTGGNPHRLHITAGNLSADNKYVQLVVLDGKVLHKPFITHAQLLHTRELTFTMGPAPRYTW
jgi:predicted alpha-1,2-mannosidase